MIRALSVSISNPVMDWVLASMPRYLLMVRLFVKLR